MRGSLVAPLVVPTKRGRRSHERPCFPGPPGGGRAVSESLLRGEGFEMIEVLTALIDATNVFGLVLYLAIMALLLGSLAWASHLDHPQERGGLH
jgi:hypothetical protein